jgi:hypothetical protein
MIIDFYNEIALLWKEKRYDETRSDGFLVMHAVLEKLTIKPNLFMVFVSYNIKLI